MDSENWVRAFTKWFVGLNREVEPEWKDAYKTAFRAGYRAALRDVRDAYAVPVSDKDES